MGIKHVLVQPLPGSGNSRTGQIKSRESRQKSRRTMRRALWCSHGEEPFLMSEVPSKVAALGVRIHIHLYIDVWIVLLKAREQ